MTSLSSASAYEQHFRTRHRAPGRPSVGDPGADSEPLFPRGDVHPLLGRVAERRAYALVHARHRDELHEIYRSELKVLARRGVEQVAQDVGLSETVNTVAPVRAELDEAVEQLKGAARIQQAARALNALGRAGA